VRDDGAPEPSHDQPHGILRVRFDLEVTAAVPRVKILAQEAMAQTFERW
jgi:hypothetical protein